MDIREPLYKDEFELVIQQHGWQNCTYKPIYNDPDVIKLRWLTPPNTNKSYPYEAFYDHFGNNTFRKLLRFIFSRPRTQEELESRYGGKKLRSYLTFLTEQEIVIQNGSLFSKSPRYQHVEGIGKTLEWYVAEWFRSSIQAPARHGVHLQGIADGGDLDIVAFVDGLKIFVECKSGKPANITDSQLELFLRRTADFHPDIALLLIDTDQQIDRQLEMLEKVYLKSAFIEPRSSRDRHLNTSCIQVRNVGNSIDQSLRATLRSHYTDDFKNRPLVGVKTEAQWRKEASIHIQSKSWAEAVAAYKQITRLNPNDALAHEMKGNILFALKQFDEALVAYRQAIQLNPTQTKVYQKIGDTLLELKRYEEAVGAYETVIQLGYDNSPEEGNPYYETGEAEAWAYMRKGEALFKLGLYEEAFIAYDEANNIYSDTFNYSIIGDSLQALNRNEEALIAYNRALELYDGNPYAYQGKAEILFLFQRFEEALAAYEQAILIVPNDPENYIGKGKVLDKLGYHKEAVKLYERAANIEKAKSLSNSVYLSS